MTSEKSYLIKIANQSNLNCIKNMVWFWIRFFKIEIFWFGLGLSILKIKNRNSESN